jgi:hypothetical protein
MLPNFELRYYRDTGTARVNGVRSTDSRSTSPTPFFANVQPSTPAEVRHLPGGEEVSAAITIYTQTELRVTNPNRAHRSDHVEYSGQRYKLRSELDWSGHGFRGYVATLLPAGRVS